VFAIRALASVPWPHLHSRVSLAQVKSVRFRPITLSLLKKALSLSVLFSFFLVGSASVQAQDDEGLVSKTDYSALELRSIGPAFNGGRIADIDFHPDDESI
jgi:hypothetical protein